MKKKLVAVIMSACVGAALLAGCGASGSAESTEKAETAAADTAETADTAESADAAESEASGASYKIGIVQYMDHASLNQITEHLEKELDAKADELNVSFDYEDYFINGQGDSTIITQGLAQLKDDGVDAVVCVATPTALTAQSTFEGTGTPIIFSAVTDPVGAGLVSSMDEPGGNITGTSDALNTEAIMNLIFAQNPDADKIGLLYSTSEDASTQAIADAKAFLDAKGVEYVEKTGTNTTEVSQAADALIAAGVDAIFTPTDNTVMSAELSIYDKLADALSSVKATGYGVVMPTAEEMKLETPEIIRKAGACGVKLKAGAPSIHMMRVDIDTEISPMVGDEKQSQELVSFLQGEDPEKLWQSNIFGKSVYELIQEGLTAKLLRMPEDVRGKFRGTLSRIVNEGATGLICLIL